MSEGRRLEVVRICATKTLKAEPDEVYVVSLPFKNAFL